MSENTERIIRQIAKQNNVSVSQIKKDMREAIRISMACDTEESKALWRQLAPDGKEPSVDAFLRFCTEKAVQRLV